MSDQKPSDWFGRGRSAASALIREKVQNYDNEHGSTDPDTGTREYPGNGDEWVFEMHELADEIDAIKPPLTAPDPRDACVDALRSIRVRGPDADGLYWLVIAPTSGGPQGALNLGPLSNIMVASAVARFNDMQSSALRALDEQEKS